MSEFAELRRISLSTKRARVQREWERAWDGVERRLADGEDVVGMIWAHEYSGWNGVIAEGSSIWFGELVLTRQRFIQISPSGSGQIALRDVEGSSYREFRRGIFKKSTYLLLTSAARISHVFSLPDEVSLSRSYCDLVESVLSLRATEKFQ